MQWFYNMKVRRKILSGFLIVAFIAAIIGIQGMLNINKVNNLDTELYEKMTKPLENVINVADASNDMRGHVRDILLTETPSEIQKYNDEIKAASDEFDENLDKLSATVLTTQGQQVLKELKTSKSNYMDIINKIIQLKNQGKSNEAVNLLYSDGKPVLEKLENDVKIFTDLKLNLAKETSVSNNKTAANTTMLTVIILIIGIVISIFIGIFISSSISKPISKIIKIANKLADGDFQVDINILGKDEIGLLADSFRKMAEKLNNTIYTINSAAEQVSLSSRQVSDTSVSLSQGAMEQASSIEELTASIEEISAQTKLSAENAYTVNEVAGSAKVNAEEGFKQMKEMQKAVDEINNSSISIAKIIKVIDEIAFQTNILALNAAVEAARAGQHGKGFAVVAEEVRNLAARSAKAAKETEEMIESSIEKTEIGTKIANQTSEALSKIVNDTVKIAEFINQIAISSSEQAEGIAQINQGVMQVSTVVQTNSATAEESAAASEELASQAEVLKEQVKQFKLKSVYL